VANPSSPHVKTFSCPSCAGSVNIRAIGSSINVVCSYCSSIIDTNDENYKVVDAFTNKVQRRTIIGLGQRGELFGTLWETIGYMERCDQSGQYVWSEYLLFNPWKGFRWLTEYGGHWSFVTTIKDQPKIRTSTDPVSTVYKNESFLLFNKGTAKVTYVLGEFYWQVRVGEQVDLQEFIAPPEILSMESNSEEIVWSLGQYVEAETIRVAFQVPGDKPMPVQTGVAPNQPSPYKPEDAIKIRKYWKYFAYAILLIHIGTCFNHKRDKVYTGYVDFSATDKGKTKVTPQFEIKDKTNIEISMSAPIENTWIEINGDFVNDENGESEEFNRGIEYYTGTDSDGAWSEGSTNTSHTIESVSKGKYHLNLEVSGPPLGDKDPAQPATANMNQPVILSIEIKTGGLVWENFWLALLFISLYPIFVWWKTRKFETARWAESDFSPYASYDSGEDDSE
jgi:hypothetical protein